MKMFDRIYDKLKNMKYGYYIAYTVLFAITALISFRFFIFYGKSLIINGDALSQHYIAINYYGKLLRDIVQNLLGGNLAIPMWDVNLGFGEDILTTLQYYGVGEPLMLLCALFPQSQGEAAFTFIFILRLYLAGLFFSYFSLYKNNSKIGTLIGCFIYLFCGYNLLQGSKHLMRGVPVIFLPLILIGVEKFLKEKKPMIFILSVAFAAMSNLYHIYALVIFTVIYFVYRYLAEEKEKSIKDFLILSVKFMLMGLLGFLISALITLPVIRVITSDERVGKGYSYSLLYPIRYYLDFIGSYTNMQRQDRVLEMGFSVLTVVSALVLFIKRKSNSLLFKVFVLFNIFALIPFCGYAFHGFSGVCNRWIWGYAFLCGIIFAKIYPYLLDLNKKERLIIAVSGGIFFLFPLLFSFFDTKDTYASIALFFIIMVFIYAYSEGRPDVRKINVCYILIFLIGQGVLTNLVWSAFSYNDSYGIENYPESGSVYDTVYKKNADDVIKSADREDYYRIAQIGVPSAMNSGALRSVKSFSRYYSTAESGILNFSRKMGINTSIDYKTPDSDRREIMDLLLNTAYYVTNTENEDKLPFNYRNKSGEEDVSLYSPDTFIPFGYTYSSFITEEEFEKLSLTDRQEVMMESAVVDGECPLEKKMPVLHNENVLKSVTKADESKLDITDNSFYLKEGYNSIIKLELINGKRNSDYYIELTGLDFKEEGKQKWYSEEAVSKMSAVERRRFKAETTFTMPDNEAKLYFGYDMEDFPYEAEYLNAGHISYTGHDSILVNLGHHEEPVNEIYIKIKEPGLYSFDELKVVCSDVSNINAQAEKLAEESLYDTQFFTNGFRGKITASSERLLVMSVPYSPGWKAYVDGQAADIYRTNVMMMGVMVGEGEHEVVLKYETPLLRIGVMLTISGVVILIILLAVGYQIRKKNGFSKEN